MGAIKMYVSLALVVLSTLGGGFYRFTIAPLKEQVEQQSLIIREQAKQLGELTQKVESFTIINAALKSENDTLQQKLMELGTKLEEEKARNGLLELGLKQAKAANDQMSQALEQQNRRVRALVTEQRKRKSDADRAIKVAQQKSEHWKAKYKAISAEARNLPIEDCGQAQYLYDQYHQSRNGQ